MNYVVEDLSALQHADDLLSGFVNPDDITYGADGRPSTRVFKNRARHLNASGVFVDTKSVNPSSATSLTSAKKPNLSGLVNAGIDIAGNLIGLIGSKKTEVDRAIKTACGRKPLLEKKRASYRACATQVLQTMINQANAGVSDGRSQEDDNKNDNSNKPELSPLAIAGIILGTVAVGTAVVLIIKHVQTPK